MSQSMSPPPFPRRIGKRPSPFAETEYLMRLARVREELIPHGVDALLVTDPGNICYLSGYGAESSYVAQGLIVRLEGPPDLVVRRQDAPAGMWMAWMPNAHILDYPEDLIGNPHEDGLDFICRLLLDHRVRRLGVELDCLSASAQNRMQARYPELRLVDLSGLVMRLRLVKSRAEIEVMREAARITDHVLEMVPEFFRPGRSEAEVAADLTAELIRGLPGLPGDRPEPIPLAGGPRTGTSHVSWTDAEIKPGRHYNLKIGACRYRYSAALMRTVVVGQAPGRLERLHDAMVEGCEAALARVWPGRLVGDLARAFIETVERHGWWKDSRCGYPIGINWLETSCSIRADDSTQIAENMAFYLMLGMWVEEDFGAVLSETFVVTAGGPEVLGRTPRRLIRVPPG